MRAPVVVSLLLAVCSCSAPAPRPPPAAPPVAQTVWNGTGKLPGLLWESPRAGWRTPFEVSWIVATTTKPIVASAEGWIAILDPVTGTFSHERTFPADSLFGAFDVGNARAMLLVAHEQTITAMIVNSATLETIAERPIAHVDRVHAAAARLPDGSFVIALPHQPLAIYDGTTFTATRTLAPAADWSDVATDGHRVFAARTDPAYPGDEGKYLDNRTHFEDQRIDLATGAVVAHVPADRHERWQWLPICVGLGAWFAHVNDVGPGREIRRDGRASIPLDAASVVCAFDPAAQRLAIEHQGTVRVFSTSDGSTIATISVNDPLAYVETIAFAGDAIYVAYLHEIRRISVAAKSVTPLIVSDAWTSQLAVGDRGEVQRVDNFIVRIVDGAVVSSRALDHKAGDVTITSPRLGVYGILADDGKRAVEGDTIPSGTAVAYRDGRATATSLLLQQTPAAWIGTDGTIIAAQYVLTPRAGASFIPGGMETPCDLGPHGWVTWRGGLGVVAQCPTVAWMDVDVDGGDALIENGHGSRLVDLRSGAVTSEAMTGPCTAEQNTSNRVRLELGGARALLWNDDVISLWNRKRGTPLAQLHVPELVPSNGDGFGTYDVEFLRGTGDVLVEGSPGLALWSPETHELRVAKIADVKSVAMSPNGRYVAIAYKDGRVALALYDQFRAALPVLPAAPPTNDECGGGPTNAE